MRVESVGDGAAERRTLIAAVVSTPFLSRVVGRVGKEPFRSRWASLVFQWCSSHYKKYGQAPGREIESLFEEFAAGSRDEDVNSLVGRFLSSLSEEYSRSGEINPDYAVDLAQRHLNEVLLEKLQGEIKGDLERGEVEAALEKQTKFVRVDLKSPPFVSVLSDEDAQERALKDRQKILVRYPGAAGEFFGGELSEDSFVAFMAPSKGGKSFALLDIAWRAMRQGRKVAYFQVGDLSRSQILRRFQARAVYRPLGKKTINYPLGIILPQSDTGRMLAVVDREERAYTEKVAWETARKALRRLSKASGGEIRLSYHPIKSVSVEGIKTILGEWDREGWKAECVVVDYAGNLSHVDNKANFTDQTANTWAMLRQISEVRKCLVVTAQQSNKEGFKSWVLTRSNFADSKMILAHVTAFLGVNMTDEEKQNGVMRYNFVVRREEQFSETYCLYLGSCLEVCNPCVVSTLPQR